MLAEHQPSWGILRDDVDTDPDNASRSPLALGLAQATPMPGADEVTVIEPPRGWAAINLHELWKHRELLFFLAWRDVNVRYGQTAIGVAWALLQPLTTMVVFSLFFGRLGGISSDGVPYPLFSFAALVPWTFFAHGLGQASNSVVGNPQLVTKVYFPRLAIPIATVFSGAIEFAIAFAILLLMMLWYGVTLTPRIIWIVPLVLLVMVSALGISLWLSALNVKYRDVRHALPFLTQLWLFATPIAYPSSLLDPQWRAWYALNPMVGVVEGFRWALLGTAIQPGPMLAASSAAAVVILAGGAVYFKRMETTFADFI
jgi:homopolymeric O-antigen transport system permease protein